MQDQEIYSKLSDVFEDVFDEPVTVTPSLTADDVDAWDSVQHVHLVLSIERAFRVKFSAGEAGEFKDVGQMVEAIKRKLG
jgi:acyl carrier protein